ncbi:MAG: hypothetical protein RID22_05870 [Roseibium aggregatum]
MTEYEEYAAIVYWFIEEAAQLCFYPDPIDHDYESYDYVPDGLPVECPAEVKHLYDRMRRAIKAKVLRTIEETDDYGSYRLAVKPMDFVSWCKSEGIELPTELVEAVHSYFDRRVQNRIDASGSEVAPATKGPPEKYDWELFYIEIIRIANGADDLPKNQAELIRHMQSWYADRNEDEPGYSTLKLKISRIYKYLREANKPKD